MSLQSLAEEARDLTQLWMRLSRYAEAGFLMGAHSPESPREVYTPLGVVLGHAYRYLTRICYAQFIGFVCSASSGWLRRVTLGECISRYRCVAGARVYRTNVHLGCVKCSVC